jgi:hypothetical protein
MRSSFRDGIFTLGITEIIFIILIFALKDTVRSERLKTIQESFVNIEYTNNHSDSNVTINSWIDGLEYIKKCPKEVGYYIRTCDILEKEKDYESAATLIELGLDFIQISPPPQPLCERLQRYYKHLDKRPKLDIDCNTFYE